MKPGITYFIFYNPPCNFFISLQCLSNLNIYVIFFSPHIRKKQGSSVDMSVMDMDVLVRNLKIINVLPFLSRFKENYTISAFNDEI